MIDFDIFGLFLNYMLEQLGQVVNFTFFNFFVNFIQNHLLCYRTSTLPSVPTLNLHMDPDSLFNRRQHVKLGKHVCDTLTIPAPKEVLYLLFFCPCHHPHWNDVL